MDFDVNSLLVWFSSHAYDPWMVYSAVVFLFTASSFGLPVPEEVTLVSLGLLAYTAGQPDKFPPPYPGAEPVNLYTLMVVAFLSVFLSDALVFFIGKFGGKKLKKNTKWKGFFRSRAFRKAEVWAKVYGAIMAGVFRFTPGLRFPGHMICGMMGLPFWKFTLVDGTAALLTVPTQIWLVATYGEDILSLFKQFKMVIAALIVVGLIVYFGRRYVLSRANEVG